MRIEDLAIHDIPEEYIRKFKDEGISELYPPQAEVAANESFKEKNVVLSLPTASGKTLLAALAIINKLHQPKSKIIYIAPLVALASEKYEYFKGLFGHKYNVALSIGDFDSSNPRLNNQKIIAVTSEKLDSLMRHNVDWIGDIGLVIVDEIHMLNDNSRGPTLEVILTKLRESAPRAQIIALSATIKNAQELADWLDATLFVSDFRPVKLYEGVSTDSEIRFHNRKGYKLTDGDDEELATNTVELGKQALFFVATRRSAESTAEKLSTRTKRHLDKSEQQQLHQLSGEIENVLESPTRQCKRLAKCIRGGVAFHHAGLLRKQKSMIEENFRKGTVKIITSTPTLAMGVNLPAWRVIIRDAKRYYHGIGSAYIPVLDYKQMIGRAGRPQYDTFGESILMAKSDQDAYELNERYILGEAEDIVSKLALEPILRTHMLSLVASGFCNTEESVSNFFSKTFYAFHYGDMSLIRNSISYIIDTLVNWGFVNADNGVLTATPMGKRVSELYIDPLTAHNFISSLEMAPQKHVNVFSILQTISNALEMKPLVGVKSSEYDDMQAKMIKESGSVLKDIPEEYDYEFEDFLKSVKMSVLFEDWMDEATDEQLLERYNIAPGEMRGKLQVADWLLHSIQELAILKRIDSVARYMRKVRIRMAYGVKEELLPLVKLKGIGRVRARRLFNAGMKTIENLRNARLGSLTSILGVSVAQSVKNQLEGRRDFKQTNLHETGQ